MRKQGLCGNLLGILLICQLLQGTKSACDAPRSITRSSGTGSVWASNYVGPLYTASFVDSEAGPTVAWKVFLSPSNSTTIGFSSTMCNPGTTVSGTYNLFSATCSRSGTTVTTTLSASSALKSLTSFEIYGTAVMCTALTTTVTIQACPNSTTTEVVQDVPANAAFGSTHNFTCSSDYALSTGAASLTSTCQADATWSPIPVCNETCDTTTIPSNTSYVSPSTSELIFVGSSKDLTCTPGYIGSASAVCNAAAGTRSWTVTNGCKAVCSQPSADYCVHGTNTSVTTVTEGSDVNVGCCNGKSGSTTAVCATPGNITLSLDCSQEQTTTTAATPSTTTTSTSSSNTNSTQGDPVGAIVGGTVGGTVCLCAVGAAAYIFYVSITLTTATVGGKSSITIKWKPQSKPTVKYLVAWKPTGGSLKQPYFVDSSQGELTIKDLDPGQTYTVEVKSKRAPSFLGSAKTIKTKSA